MSESRVPQRVSALFVNHASDIDSVRLTEEAVRLAYRFIQLFQTSIMCWAASKKWVSLTIHGHEGRDTPPAVYAPWSSPSVIAKINPRPFLSLMELIGTEFAEYEVSDSPENAREELADAAIRILNTLGEYGIDPYSLPPVDEVCDIAMPRYMRDASMGYAVHQASEGYRGGGPEEPITPYGAMPQASFVCLVTVMARIAEELIPVGSSDPAPALFFVPEVRAGSDVLEMEILKKMNANAKRAVLHGKRC